MRIQRAGIALAAVVLSFQGLSHTAAPAGRAPGPADAVPTRPENGPFLFSYFFGNGDGLHLAASEDGLTFTPLNNDKIYLKPTIGVNNDGTEKDAHLMRDPCIRQGPDGMYHLVWTTGWYQRGFGVASSPDLIHWGEQRYVEVNKNNPTALNTWAPELFFNDQKNEWIIFWATTIPGQFKETEPASGGDRANGRAPLNHRIYYVSTKDFQTFSDAKLLVDPKFNCIDATIAKVPAGSGALAGRYMMVIKDETAVPTPAKNLRTLVAENPEGPWSALSEPISKTWVEGPTVAQVKDAWYVYYDEYTRRTYGAIRTTDFKTWTEVKENFAFPKGARHGTVFPVSRETLDRLKREAPFDGAAGK